MARFFRLPQNSMRARLMVPLIGLVMALIIMLQCWVLHAMKQYYQSEAGRDLTVNASMFNATEEIHRRNLQSRFELIAKDPRLKAFLMSKDSPLQQEVLSEILAQEAVKSAVLHDNRGRVRAAAFQPHGPQRPGFDSKDIPCSHDALNSPPIVQTTFVDGSLIDCVTTPIVINDTIEARLLVTLERNPSLLTHFKQATHSDIAILVNGDIVHSTLPITPSIRNGLKTLWTRQLDPNHQKPSPVILEDDWICDLFPLLTHQSTTSNHIVLLSSTRELHDQLCTAQWRIWGFGLLTMIASIPILLRTVTKVTRPLNDLRMATHAIAQGNLSARVPSDSKGEIGALAMDFNRMSEALALSVAENERARRDLETRVDQRTLSLTSEIARREQAEEKIKCYAEGLEHLVEQRTLEMKRAYRTLDAMEDGAMVIEPNSLYILFINQGGAAHLGYKASEMVSMPLTHVMLDFNPSNFTKFIQPLLKQETSSLSHQGRSRKRDGSILHVETKFQLMQEHDERPHLIAVVRDVTERIERERIERRTQRLQSIGTLAGGIAHDLNNTLTPILMGIDLVRIEYPSLGMDEHFGVVQQSARRAADMAKRLLAFARGADGERSPLDVNEQVRSIYKVMLSTFDKSIEIQSHLAPNLPTVLADGTQLQQVILNLCVNAQDAMPKGGSLTLSTSLHIVSPNNTLQNPEINPGTYVCISVKDSGHGIPSEILDQIFDPFFTTKGPDKGTGMGLAIVTGIIRGHGGFIRLKSEIDRGSDFKVYLPCCNQSAEGTPQNPASILHANGELILIVDDEVEIQRGLTLILRKMGFQTLTASNGKEGIDQFQIHQSRIKLIITDIHMPVLDGVLLSKAIRRASSSVPIIFMTGRTEDSTLAELRSLPRMHHLSKPFDFTTLSQTLKALIASK